jgi:hypothetical protein
VCVIKLALQDWFLVIRLNPNDAILAIHSFIKGWLLSQIASSSLGETLSNFSLSFSLIFATLSSSLLVWLHQEKGKISLALPLVLFNWNCIKEEGLHLLLPWTETFGKSLPSLLMISLVLSCLFASLHP